MTKLIERKQILENEKASQLYLQLASLLNALHEKELPSETIDFINQEILELNTILVVDKHFTKAIKKKENSIIKFVEQKHKIVPKDYYRKLWMVLGMSAFGIPMGVVFGITSGNMGLIGIGLPIGLAVGITVGSGMDKKALNEGRQLDVEIKH